MQRSHGVFRGLEFEPDEVIGQKGALCKGLRGRMLNVPNIFKNMAD